MERGRAGKAFMCGMTIMAISAGLLSGCSKQNVDYGKKETETVSGTMESFAAEQDNRWVEDLEYTDADGEKHSIQIRAAISVPDMEEMSVVTVKQFEFTPENKQRVAEAIFGEEVYSYTLRELLERSIAECEDERAFYDDVIKEISYSTGEEIQRIQEIQSQYDEKIAEYKKYLETAVEEPEKVKDYEADWFLGRIGEMYYTLSFEEGMQGLIETSATGEGKAYTIQQIRGINLNPEESLSEILGSKLENSTDTEYDFDLGTEDTEQMLRGILEKAGFDGLCTQSQTNVPDGLSFSFAMGVDGTSFQSFGTAREYIENLKEWGGALNLYNNMTDSISALVVRYLKCMVIQIYDPMEMVSVTSDVNLLALDDVKTVFRKVIEEQVDFSEYNVPGTIKLNNLDLVYFRITDTEREGYYSYVPAWRLSAGGYNFVVMINAIDGSVIDVTGELAGSVEG